MIWQKSFLVALLVFFIAGCSEIKLPQKALEGKWQLVEQKTLKSWDLIKNFVGQDQFCWAEYDLEKLGFYLYHHDQSQVDLEVKVYQLNNSDNAFGLYNYLMPEAVERYAVGDEAFRFKTILIVRADNLVMRIKPAKGGIALDDLLEFSIALCRDIPRKQIPVLASDLLSITKEKDISSVAYGHSYDSAKRYINTNILEYLYLSLKTDYAFMNLTNITTTAVLIDYPTASTAKQVEARLLELAAENKIFNIIRKSKRLQFFNEYK